jgi:hypothetical protein
MMVMNAAAPGVCLALSLFALPGCRMPSQPDSAGVIANLRFSPAAFDSFRRNTDIVYTLKQAARVSIAIVKRPLAGEDQPVLTLFAQIYESRGTHAHTWLGDTAGGLFAPPGDYVGIVAVDGCRYEATVRVFHY